MRPYETRFQTGAKMTTKNAYDLEFRPSSEEEGGATVPFARVFGEEDFESNFRWVDLCIVTPGAEIGVHEHLVDDEIYVILKGNAIKIVNDEEAQVGPGDAILLKCGGSHGLRNESDQEVHVLVIDLLAPLERNQRMLLRNISDVPMRTKKSMGGVGQIQVGDIFTGDELGGAWDFVQCVKLPPGSAIGVHQHEGDEECYYIIDGRGLMAVDGEEFLVGPGVASLCRSGSSHGVVNNSDGDITILVAQAPVG